MNEPELSSSEHKDAESGDEDRGCEKIREEYEELRVRYKDLEETLRWLQADYENYKKGIQRNIDLAIEQGCEKIFYDILPVLDGMDEFAGMKMSAPLLDGVNGLRRSMLKALSDHGLEPLSRVGEPFDPGIEEAVDVALADDVGEGTVIEEVRKGYRFRGKILRHPLVRISKLKDRGDKDG